MQAWTESDRVFTQENGKPYHPDWISRRFKRLVELSGLPPVRLHDLRHISATLSLLAKNDIKVVQERLGHSSRQITSDTYTSVLLQLMTAEAESTIATVPRAERKASPKKKDQDGAEESSEDSSATSEGDDSAPDEDPAQAA